MSPHRILGALLYRLAPDRRLRYLSVHDPERAGPRGLLAASLQRYVLSNAAAPDLQDPPSSVSLERLLDPARYVDELASALTAQAYMPAGILNTEALLLWSLVRRAMPTLYLESGTGRGYSASLVAQALARNPQECAFHTFGTDTPERVEATRRNLRHYPAVDFVEGKAELELPARLAPDAERIAIFVDGPKGSSPAFLELLERIFQRSRPLFLAIHDCELHLPRGFDPGGKWPQGRINPTRSQLDFFFADSGLADDYVLAYMDNRWCLRFEELNRPIYDHDAANKPFEFKGSRQRSHGTVIGTLLSRRLIDELRGAQRRLP